MYAIRYNHTENSYAATVAGAKAAAREELRRVAESAHGADNMVVVRCDNGLYVYADQEAADADDTGTGAFAIISSADEDEE